MVAMLNYLGQLNGDYRILLIGKADRFGIGLYNQSLAFKRAEIVRNYLIKNGVAESLIEMRSAGETFPDILTKDGVQQQKNRVVEIYILKGIGSFSDFPLPLVQNKVYRQEIIKARKERGLND
jgi:outer membrane protein OmpA-like peptidoglycan-associated protein